MEENWFIFKEDHHLGPFSASTLLDMLEDQEVTENVLVWKEGFDAWLPLKDCPEFQFEDEIDEGPPPLPPLPIVEEDIQIMRAARNLDELMSDAKGLHPEDLQPEIDAETSEKFWSEVEEENPRFTKAERDINPLEYDPSFHDQSEIDEVVEEHQTALHNIEDDEEEAYFVEETLDEGPPPLPPLPDFDDSSDFDEVDEQEFLFEQTDVYEDEVVARSQADDFQESPEEFDEDYEENFEEDFQEDEEEDLVLPPQSSARFKQTEDVFEGIDEDHHALDQVEAEQADREKRADLLIHGAWAVACLTFILFSLYLVFGLEQRKEHFTGLTKSDFNRLTAISKKAGSGSLEGISFDLAVGTDLQTIWGASNRKGPAGLFLSMKSVDDNLMGIGPVLVNSVSELDDAVVAFDKFEIVEGDRVYPGLYNVHLKVYDTSLKQRFFLFLKKVPWLGKLGFIASFKGVADYNKQILMYDGSLADFKTKLAEYKKKNQEYRARPIRQRIEAYSTLSNLSKKIFDIYQSAQSKINQGKDITEFESVYGTQVSPLLQGIILDNIKKQRMIKNQNPDEEKEYDKLVMYGRKVGEFAADIVTEHRSLKKLSNKKKKALLSKYQNTVGQIEREGEKLIGETNQLLRNL
ncbi:MAG: DUF4339 domain-containing protein [Deltaproteobacteria bacterium]|nr:MAG: DUF4339 domain-containing protein [Deltaproteobacteria bacterium]